MRPMTATSAILDQWHSATAGDLASGLAWYERARDIADSLAAGSRGQVTPAQAAGVIAALSPRVGWSVNVKAATKMVDAYVNGEPEPIVAGLSGNRRKAWAILNSDADPLTILSGPKVRAFYSNIMGDSDAVTVDSWAARAAGHPTGHVRPKDVAAISDAYREAASALGQSPRDVQAAVWTFYRRVHSRANYD